MENHVVSEETPAEFRLDAYDFALPEDRIALHPPAARGTSRLLRLSGATGDVGDHVFSELPDLLPEGAVLVANHSRVAPARCHGVKESGGKVEMLLLTPPPLLQEAATRHDDWREATALTLLRAAKRPRPGQRVTFGPDLEFEHRQDGEFGQAEVRLRWRGALGDVLERVGRLPLPPYIQREVEAADATRYQTVYADPRHAGSVAAPTAGLHFTQALRQELAARGFPWLEATLHVGYGTFSPVRVSDIRLHRLHAEYVDLPEATAKALREAKAAGRPVVAVGTTACRILEGVHRLRGTVEAFAGWVDCFIHPPMTLQVVDHLLTNFHLPKSSLLMLVAALAGRERLLAAYAQAIERGYRFYSYGDAMLVL